VAIVGLGRVGATNAAVIDGRGHLIHRNHLHAARACGCRIVALVDPDPRRRADALAIWSSDAGPDRSQRPPALHADIGEIPIGAADIITIASPPSLHPDHFAAAMHLLPRVVLIEKPLAIDLEQAQAMAAHAAGAAGQTAIYVNFNRRADAGMRAWRRSWAARKPQAVTMRYGKGLMNYASHLVDHALDWFGMPARVLALPPYQSPGAAPCGDDSPSFLLEYENGLVLHVLGLEGISYDMFEIDVYFPDGMASARNNAAEKHTYQVVPDLYYPGYAGLVVDPTAGAAIPIGGFTETYHGLADQIAGRRTDELNLCGLDAAVNGLTILHAVRRSCMAHGRPVVVKPTIPSGVVA